MLGWERVGRKAGHEITREACNRQLDQKRILLFVLTSVGQQTTLSVNLIDLSDIIETPARQYQFDSADEAKRFANRYSARMAG